MEELNRDQSYDNENHNERSNGEDKSGDQHSKSEELKNGAKEEEEEERKEEMVLQFLDSLDSYLTLTESLSSILRQGWLDLASARYSMGSSRVTSALFDLKLHPAATTLKVTQLDGESLVQDSMMKQPQFSLSRWSSTSDETESCEEQESNTCVLRHRGNTSPRSPLIADDQFQKERSKPLSVFGTLVSPKLRESQVSFETALEIVVEIANMRSKMLSAYAQIQQ